MEREQNQTDPDGLAEVWRSAEQRRAEDIRAWLGHVFEKWRRPKTSGAETRYPQGNPALR
jgi:hypothetical protein